MSMSFNLLLTPRRMAIGGSRQMKWLALEKLCNEPCWR